MLNAYHCFKLFCVLNFFLSFLVCAFVLCDLCLSLLQVALRSKTPCSFFHFLCMVLCGVWIVVHCGAWTVALCSAWHCGFECWNFCVFYACDLCLVLTFALSFFFVLKFLLSILVCGVLWCVVLCGAYHFAFSVLGAFLLGVWHS